MINTIPYQIESLILGPFVGILQKNPSKNQRFFVSHGFFPNDSKPFGKKNTSSSMADAPAASPGWPAPIGMEPFEGDQKTSHYMHALNVWEDLPTFWLLIDGKCIDTYYIHTWSMWAP